MILPIDTREGRAERLLSDVRSPSLMDFSIKVFDSLVDGEACQLDQLGDELKVDDSVLCADVRGDLEAGSQVDRYNRYHEDVLQILLRDDELPSDNPYFVDLLYIILYSGAKIQTLHFRCCDWRGQNIKNMLDNFNSNALSTLTDWQYLIIIERNVLFLPREKI